MTILSPAAVNDVALAWAPASVSPYLLPIELLSEIFLWLNIFEVAGASQVCRTWHAASTDVRLWRHLSFKETKPFHHPPRDPQLQCARFESIASRSGNTVESIELEASHLILSAILSASLRNCTQTLKHIRWSSEGGPVESLRVAVRLARRCPQLEMLELNTWHEFDLTELVNDTTIVAKPRHVSIVSGGRSEVLGPSLFIPDTHAALFDHATTLEFKLDRCQWSFARSQWIPVQTFARLLKNLAVKKLTVHGLCSSPTTAYEVSAPSLTYLDLRWSLGISESALMIDAPKLRELLIDLHLLPKLTLASTSALSSLTLRCDFFRASLDAASKERARNVMIKSCDGRR